MKERPILFSTEMVQAILAGRKTQTRRVIKPPKGARQDFWIKFAHEWKLTGKLWEPLEKSLDRLVPAYKAIKCPYGVPGDKLWVRETWAWHPRLEKPSYKASEYGKCGAPKWSGGWRPSIHMPKKYARIWLEVKDVRVERVCDISPNDIYAEGVSCGEPAFESVKMFQKLWDSINAKRGYGWYVNPWVWVVEFEKI